MADRSSVRPRSEAQRAASRTNGAKSQGPVTPEGKAVSSRNALKHGFDAKRFFFLSDEDRQAFEAWLPHLQARFAPADEIAERLVRHLARVMWRIEHAEQWEAAVLDAGSGRPSPERGRQPVSPSVATTFPVRRFYQVMRIQRQLQESFAALLDALRSVSARYCRNEPKTGNFSFDSRCYGSVTLALMDAGCRLGCKWPGLWSRAGPSPVF